jgi:hypothetical protein
MKKLCIDTNNKRRGSASVVAFVAITVLVGLCGAMLMIASRSNSEAGATVNQHQATSTAEAGLDRALAQVMRGDTTDIGSADAPEAFGGGNFWVEIDPNEDAGLVTVTAYAQVRGEGEALQALLTAGGNDIYDHALFAGNTSNDPLYALGLGGTGSQADQVLGDVYSGGSVDIAGDANVTGTIRAQDAVNGAAGEAGVYQPVPDISAMDYENSADFNVADLFTSATYEYDDAGGNAWQLPESDPAHIFRKNPSDRSTDVSSTVKDDYFLEDPYEPVNLDKGSDGSNAYALSISGVSGEPGVDGNHKVYYIDGNLWIHNRKTYSFKLKHNEANGVQITFIAKGNIYFSDNVFYENTAEDGIAFIAMRDDGVSDSGNIYFGDPIFGTLEQMHAFMYAENDFVDKNMSASGSATVAVYGNMTAGNQMNIERDYGDQHSRLTVNYDGRISSGDLDMPGLPGTNGAGGGDYVFRAMRRVARP